MPKRKRLDDITPKDPARLARVKRRHKTLMERLARARTRFASGSHKQLDEALGRKSGYLTSVFSGGPPGHVPARSPGNR